MQLVPHTGTICEKDKVALATRLPLWGEEKSHREPIDDPDISLLFGHLFGTYQHGTPMMTPEHLSGTYTTKTVGDATSRRLGHTTMTLLSYIT